MTFWLGIAGTIAIVITLHYTRRAAIAAQDAADTARKALTDLERPFVYLRVVGTGIRVNSSDVKFFQAKLAFLNVGRTPARLTRIVYRFRPAPKGDIAAPIDAERIGGRGLPVGCIATPDRPYEESENLRAQFNIFDQQAVSLDRKSIWLVGFARYEDVFGQNHIVGFGMVYDELSERFVIRGGTNYNYERKENPADIPPPSEPDPEPLSQQEYV